MNLFNCMFMSIIIMGVTLTMSTNNWMSAWAGLELSTMGFIPVMKNNPLSVKSMMTYFLIQSGSSVTLLFSLMMSMIIVFPPSAMKTLIEGVMMASIMTKIGLAPFHLWMPFTMSYLKWLPCLQLITLQKMAPLTLMNLMNPSSMILIIAMTSAATGAISGLNQTSIKKMVAYSSINHSSWMIMAIFMKMNWMVYMLLYSIIMTPLCIFMEKETINYINQLSMKNTIMNTIMSISMLSMAGMPPFTGFFPKYMIISMMINLKYQMTAMIMTLSSMMTMFFYISISITMMTLQGITNKLNIYKKLHIMHIAMIANIVPPLSFIMNFTQ